MIKRFIVAGISIFVLIILIQSVYTIFSDFPGDYSAERNFHLYKSDREEILRRLESGEIKKEDRFNNGFSSYYTPSEFKDANKNDIIQARMHGDKYFVFFLFKSENRSLDFGPGIAEGFLYSSTGKEPKNNNEFQYIGIYQRIDKHWFFVKTENY
jgi:hypothetical protein